MNLDVRVAQDKAQRLSLGVTSPKSFLSVKAYDKEGIYTYFQFTDDQADAVRRFKRHEQLHISKIKVTSQG